MPRMIIVALDGSPLAERALPVAETLSKRTNWHLALVRAVPYLSRPEGDATYRTLAAARAAATVEARCYLDGLVARLAARGVAATAIVPEEDEAAGILAAAHHDGADLIVMATHGRSGLGRWVYGSVAEEVLAAAPLPVLLVRAWHGAPPDAALEAGGAVLVPLDGSILAETALPIGERLADDLGGELLLLRVVPHAALLRAEALASQEAIARTYLAKLAGRLGGRGRRILTEVRVGAAAAAIEAVGLEYTAGLVVMATHGLTGLRRSAMGSVADAVVWQDSLPVLLVGIHAQQAGRDAAMEAGRQALGAVMDDRRYDDDAVGAGD